MLGAPDGGPAATMVSAVGVPPVAGIVERMLPVAAKATKAIRVPSGGHDGSPRRGAISGAVEPSALAVHRFGSAAPPCGVASNASLEPVGDHAGCPRHPPV